jgi:hypothetical protein
MMHDRDWIGKARTVARVLCGLAILVVLGCAEERPPIPAIPASRGQQAQSEGMLGSARDCARSTLIRCAPGTWVINFDCPKGTKCPGRATVVIGADGNLVRVEEIPAQYQMHGWGVFEDDWDANTPKQTFLFINITSAPVDPKEPYAYTVGNFKGLHMGNNHWEGHMNGPGPDDKWVSLSATADLK